MEIVSIKQEYTDYLFNHDNRVSYNVDKEYVRPYLGVLLQVKNLKYFAPLTSSGKGKKLAQSPKPESITFYPIDNCKLGGINLNNMIPLVDGVYKKYTEIVNLNSKQQSFHEKQIRFLRKHRKHIRQKALKIYTLKITGRLYPNYDNVTCDFKKLEEAAIAYANNVKTSLQQVQPKDPVDEKSKLTPGQFAVAERLADEKGKTTEKVVKVFSHMCSDGFLVEKKPKATMQTAATKAVAKAPEKKPVSKTQEKITKRTDSKKSDTKKKPQRSR